MSAHDEDRIQHLLRQALPPVAAELDDPSSLEPSIDLWPQVLKRLDSHPAVQPQSKWIWFDWALVAGLAVVTVSFPASIPLLFYYL